MKKMRPLVASARGTFEKHVGDLGLEARVQVQLRVFDRDELNRNTRQTDGFVIQRRSEERNHLTHANPQVGRLQRDFGRFQRTEKQSIYGSSLSSLQGVDVFKVIDAVRPA